MSAVPEPNPAHEANRRRIILTGDVPSPANPPEGCNFCTRCPKVMDICRRVEPVSREIEPGRFVACHLYETTTTAGPTAAPEASGENRLSTNNPTTQQGV